MGKRISAFLVLIAIGFAVAWYFLQANKIPPSIRAEPSVPIRPTIDKNTVSDVVAAKVLDDGEEMIHGVPASKNVGQYAAERPASLDPYRRWAPPIMRSKWLAKSEVIMLEKHTFAADAEYRGVYFHLGFMDKPASCGEVRFIDHDSQPIGDFERYLYSGRGSLHLESELPDSFHVIWKKLCVETIDNKDENS